MDPKIELEAFGRTFTPDVGALGPVPDWTPALSRRLIGNDVPSYTRFLRTAARQSYGGGLVRFLLPGGQPSLADWNGPGGWKEDWPLWSSRLCVIAYDWLGRQIGLDLQRKVNEEPAIGILEPGTGQLLEVPEGFSGFITRELIEHTDAALASDFFAEWRGAGGASPQPHQCVGYKQPLFLGGQDVVDNLDIADMAVYVSLCGQLYEQVRRLPPGARIDRIKLEG